MGEIVFLNKWLHLLSIVGVLGGIAFAWIVLPAASPEEAQSSELVRGMWRRFGIGLAVLWLVVLLTGFYNMALVSPSVNGKYQLYLGMKMALAILMFLLSLLIAHPIPAMARFFRNRPAWLLVLILLGVVVVGLSAHLNLSRLNGTGLKPPAPSSATSSAMPGR